MTRLDWHWQPGDGMTLVYRCECPPNAPGCYCSRKTEAENNYLQGWNHAVERIGVAVAECNCPESGTSGSCPFHDSWTVMP